MGDNASALGELKRWLLPPNGLDDCEREALEGGIVLIERLKAENARLTAEVERMTLRWSGERPTEAGRYWIRLKNDHACKWLTTLSLDSLEDENWRWLDDKDFAGPIKTPVPRDDGPIAVREPKGEGEALP